MIEDSYSDVDEVDENESNSFPNGNVLVEEHNDQIDDRANVEDDIAEEGALVDRAVRGDSNQSSDHRGDEHSSTRVCSHTDLSHTGHDGHHEGEYIGSTVSEGEEGHSYELISTMPTARSTCNARRDMKLIDDRLHHHAEILIGSTCKQGEEENQDKHPQKRQPGSGGRGTAVLEVARRKETQIRLQVVDVVSLIGTSNLRAVESFLCITALEKHYHNLNSTRINVVPQEQIVEGHHTSALGVAMGEKSYNWAKALILPEEVVRAIRTKAYTSALATE